MNHMASLGGPLSASLMGLALYFSKQEPLKASKQGNVMIGALSWSTDMTAVGEMGWKSS